MRIRDTLHRYAGCQKILISKRTIFAIVLLQNNYFGLTKN